MSPFQRGMRRLQLAVQQCAGQQLWPVTGMGASVTTIRLADRTLRDPAYGAAARERASQVGIVLSVGVPVGTAPISVPIAVMVVMRLSEGWIVTSHRAEKCSRDCGSWYLSHGRCLSLAACSK